MSVLRTIAGSIKRRIFPYKETYTFSVLNINARYDLETTEIIRRLGATANCIDVGAHKGDILQHIFQFAPQGRHFAFEPLPHLFEELKRKYSKQCSVFPYALSDANGATTFNYVISNPAYSGIKKRKYDRPQEQDTQITVEQRKLDDVIPAGIAIHFIKIDVEGGEFGVVKGAQRIINDFHPTIIYEQGRGGSDVYGTDPGEFFDFMTGAGYQVSLMEYYLMNKESFTREEYCQQFRKSYNFYFIAYIK